MVGWHHQLNGHEFEQTPGDSDEQGSLVYCDPWGHKESDTIQQLNNNNKTQKLLANRQRSREIKAAVGGNNEADARREEMRMREKGPLGDQSPRLQVFHRPQSHP